MELSVLNFLPESMVPINRGILFVLVLILLIAMSGFLFSVYLHEKRKQYIAKMALIWKEMIDSIFEQNSVLAEMNISDKNRKYFRDFLVYEYFERPVIDQYKIRHLYKHLGFLDEDLFQLRNRGVWKKVEALKRLTELHFENAEAVVVDLLEDRKSEVRMAALKMLSTINSKLLFDMLPALFENHSQWNCQKLVNILFAAEIPAGCLRSLASSLNGELRKAAALLLGADGKEEAIPMLCVLAKDPLNEVRREAVAALGRINSDETVVLVSRKSFDRHPPVRETVAKALRNAQGDQKLFVLNRLADDPEYNVRYHAFFSLNLMGPNGKDVIRTYSNKYPDLVREFVPATC
jgi:hypothetical protein